MRRLALPAAAVALLLAVLIIVASALGRPQEPPPAAVGGSQVRVEQIDAAAFPEISLYVSALDEAGDPIAGLSSADFAVTEDGRPVELAAFGGLGAEPVSSVLVIDRSGSMEEDDKIAGAREAAAAFVELMRPADQAALIAFNDDVDLEQRFTGDQEDLLDAIEGLDASGSTALYDGIVAGVELLRDQPGRRVLLVLSDGQDCREWSSGCPFGTEGSENSLEEAIAYAEEAGQPVVVVGLGNRSAAGEGGIDEEVLQQIAGATGGRYFYAPQADELAGLYTGLADSVQQEYRLTYVSPRSFYDGTRRDIAVRVGGAQAAVGYTERHLINVVSSPVAGVALLLPLVGLLALPGVLRRRAARRVPVVGSYQPEAAQPVLMTSPAASPPPAPDPATIVAGTRRCVSCDTPLRATAHFCSRCGAAQGE